jgi:hypothetical protein
MKGIIYLNFFRYVEAHFVKVKADNLQKIETDKYFMERNDKIRAKSEALASKQMLERNALKQKYETEYEMLKKEKEDEGLKLISKFKKKKLDLEMQQKQEKNLNENENLMKASKIIIT